MLNFLQTIEEHYADMVKHAADPRNQTVMVKDLPWRTRGRHRLSYLLEYRCWEFDTDRSRFMIGDLARWEERESGCRLGPSFQLEMSTDHIGDFDDRKYGEHFEQSRYYLTHSFAVMFWRWGVSLAVRGRQIDHEWDIPRWQLNNPDYE